MFLKTREVFVVEVVAQFDSYIADWGQIAAIVGRCNEARDARTELAALLPEVILPSDQKSLAAKLEQLDRFLAACRPGMATPVPGRASGLVTAD